MVWRLGIIGKPNVGKSTFFSAATLVPAKIADYPFTTITPSRGIAYVRTQCICTEFKVKDNPRNSMCIDGVRLIPIELIDCAGLVPGAWQGRGLGNQFLDEIRKADALLHLVDASGSTDEEGKPRKPGYRDPVEDVKFLEDEITMWVFQILRKEWSKVVRLVEHAGKKLVPLLEERLSGLSIKKSHIIKALDKLELVAKKPSSWKEEDLINFSSELWKISKPTLIVANKVDMPFAEENIERLKELGYHVIPCCAEAELALRRAAENGLIKYTPSSNSFEILDKNIDARRINALNLIKSRVLDKWKTTGVQDAINYAVFNLLKLIVVYPVENSEKLTDHHGNVLPDALLVPEGTTARELAYKIHSELGDSFICAIDARTKRRVSENYLLKSGDVIQIVSSKARG